MAPTFAVMIEGTESTPNATMPSGKRLPGSWVKTIRKNWPSWGRTPHRHDLFGATKPRMADAMQIAGMPMLKYNPESQASRLPETMETPIHTTIPIAMAHPYLEYALFMSHPSWTFLRSGSGKVDVAALDVRAEEFNLHSVSDIKTTLTGDQFSLDRRCEEPHPCALVGDPCHNRVEQFTHP